VRAGVVAIALMLAGSALAQPAPLEDAVATRSAMAQANAEAAAARQRAQAHEAAAASATAQADRTAREAAATAARIQQTEAEIAAGEAHIRLIGQQRAELRARLAERQRPLVRLTAALQRLSRRPLVVSLLRPGSVADAMHTRALLETLLPEVERRTAALRADLVRLRSVEAQARGAAQAQAARRAQLADRRRALDGIEAHQRLAAQGDAGAATREAERALGLAEQARDLGGLIDRLEEAASLRERLARLPGPVLRPDVIRPEAAPSAEAPASEAPSADAGVPGGYGLPAWGRLVSGFGVGEGARGIAIAVAPGAQVVAPAAGRVVFADVYAGYGRIVILEHAEGWTSVITGLARLDVRVGDQLVAGAPLGVAAAGRAVLGLELRHDGMPVNPLDQPRPR